MEILSVKQGNEIFNVGDFVEHVDGTYITKIVKFTQGPREDQMLFYFIDSDEKNGFEESGKDNYVKDLKNFRVIYSSNK